MKVGILLVSHVKEIAIGIQRLVGEVAQNVSITIAGGLEEGAIGTSFETILAAIAENESDVLLAFYDLGSAKMNLEMAAEVSEKTVYIQDAALVEGAYVAAAAAQAGCEAPDIIDELKTVLLPK